MIKLHVNAENADAIAAARRSGADGVGLFRTEFLFMKRRELPTEDEQFRAYRDGIVAMAGRPVDAAHAGPRCRQGHRRSARHRCRGESRTRSARHPVLLARRDIFSAQLRAMLRASAYGPMRILLPMVSSVEEVREARELIEL